MIEHRENVVDLEDYNTMEVKEEYTEDDVTEDYPDLSIKIESARFSIFELKRRYDRGMICVDPDFQRLAVWSNKQKSELIESVICLLYTSPSPRDCS